MNAHRALKIMRDACHRIISNPCEVSCRAHRAYKFERTIPPSNPPTSSSRHGQITNIRYMAERLRLRTLVEWISVKYGLFYAEGDVGCELTEWTTQCTAGREYVLASSLAGLLRSGEIWVGDDRCGVLSGEVVDVLERSKFEGVRGRGRGMV